ncbi:aminotransferase class V-fold PLP-dependent enzyme [Vibrio sagamiensis]|uniref:Aminotransferase n=1 Tax=Vibrio sagamiensis NBRC 104589 TaxID=1219064 RepID=A0A511QDH5_9VIBR|nr:aminotransferase class V-fold PLP-dependent enzyme [Vibrio sagamiensis]PNQ54055.1 aminotransferase class V-fold PLP-dependent enzyme [Vibrio agarivorans]GEM75364.1 aminotransferase [Vibrio sagamiensis NBRC 104589]
MLEQALTKTNQSRRNFIKGAAGAAVAGIGTSVFSSSVQANLESLDWEHSAQAIGAHKGFWRKVKKQFVLDKQSTYMNVGTTGSMPKHVLEAYDRNNTLVAKNPWDMKDKFGPFPHVEEMYHTIAPGFGAGAEELVLTRNTTDGVCSIINGLHFEPGDIILTTNHEHVAVTSPLHVVAHRFGVQVIEVQLPVFTGTETVTEKDYINAFRDVIEAHQNIRLMVFSHVTYKTGTALPAKAICRIAKKHCIPTLVDGAHTIGMLALDFHDIDCDFYVGSGHKWQCGPGGTGILYIRKDAKRLNEYWHDRETPLWMINSSISHSEHLSKQLRMQYVGNDNYPAKQALTDSCKMWDQIGRQSIQDRILTLSKQCKAQIRKVFPQATVYSPGVEGLMSGLTTFNPFSDVTNEEQLILFRDRLREEYGYIIRTTSFKLTKEDLKETHALRISTHLFHDDQDVTGLVKAMSRLYYTL